MEAIIIQIIKEKKVTQAQISKWTGLKPKSVGRIMRGESRMTADFVSTVLRNLDYKILFVPADQIILG